MKLQESFMSDIDAMAREHSELWVFICDALNEDDFNLDKDEESIIGTIEFLMGIFENAHKQLDMAPMQVTEKKLKMNKEDILKAIKEVLTEKKATYCGRCGHTHVKGTPCPRPFKEGLSTYGDDAYFVAPNKGKMKKEDILKAIKEVLTEDIAQNIVTATNKPDIKKALQQRGVTDTSMVDKAKPGQIIAAEDIDLGHEDNEPHMIKSELYQIAKYAIELYKMVDQFDGETEVDFPAWWQSKITKANSMVSSAKHYLEFELAKPAMDQAMVEEAAVKNANKINFLKKERAQLMRDMEQEAEPEGGPIADEYGSKLNKIDAAIAKLSGRKEMTYDQAVVGAEDMSGLNEKMLVTIDRIDTMARDIAAKYFKTRTDKFAAIEILKKAIEDSYKILDPDVEIREEKLDPVGHEDKDIDNDGKVDKTDKYLKGRRVKIGQAIAQHSKKK